MHHNQSLPKTTTPIPKMMSNTRNLGTKCLAFGTENFRALRLISTQKEKNAIQSIGVGETHWQTNPLDIDLRRYLIRYGEMAQATYDTFIKEKASKNAGDCRYNMKNFFSEVGLDSNHPIKYNVTKYIYATSGISLRRPDIVLASMSREATTKESNWIGYVAVATDEAKAVLGKRDIVVAWRGTEQPLEWFSDLQFLTIPVAKWLGDPSDRAKVHGGFYSVYTSTSITSSHNNITSARDQVLDEVRRLVDQFKDEDTSITITGHSLGAALATLNAVDIVANKYNIPTNQPPNTARNVTAMVFASPRVGDLDFKKTYSKYEKLHCLRVENALDIVPLQPPLGFAHVGEVLHIDSTKSPFLKFTHDLKDFHNLEVYLHGVAGTQGSDAPFKLAVDRDIALVNKGGDLLKDEYLVPQGWWVEKNKGMVQQENGTWKLIDFDL